MKYLIKIKIPNETGNIRVKDPKFGMKIQEILTDVKAEAAYFTIVDGCRGGYALVNINDASQIPAVAEPFFSFFGAEVDFLPVMTIDDLAKAGPVIESANRKWGE